MRRFLACSLLLSLLMLPFPAPADDDREQFRLDLIMAKRGDFDAQFSVGAAYEYGRGVEIDLKQAFHWYKKAAGNGHHRGQFKVGEFYERGAGGVPRDLKKAQVWYRLAAMGKVKEARQRLQALARKKPAPRPVARIQPAKSSPRKPARKPSSAPAKPRHHAAAKPQPAPARPKPARRQPSPPRYRPEELLQRIKETAWRGTEVENRVLPATDSKCLNSGRDKLICFSRQRRYVIGERALLTQVKSTLSDFRPDGRFKVVYLFQVLALEPAATPGPQHDPYGLRVETGWQEPAQEMSCQLLGKAQLVCRRQGQRWTFRAH